MLPGQTAIDPIANKIPAYVDMIRVATTLKGETLMVVFNLRDIPEEMEFNRKGVDLTTPEHMGMVHIDADGEDESEFERFEYTLEAFSAFSLGLAHPQATLRSFEDGAHIKLWEHRHEQREHGTLLVEVLTHLYLHVSHEDNTLSLISDVPGITSKSVLMVSTFDTLFGHDGISCQPG